MTSDCPMFIARSSGRTTESHAAYCAVSAARAPALASRPRFLSHFSRTPGESIRRGRSRRRRRARVRRAGARRRQSAPAVSIGACTTSLACPGLVVSRPSASRDACRRPRTGTIGSSASIGQQEAAGLEAARRRPSALRVPSGKMMSDSPSLHQRAPAPQDAGAIRVPAIDQQVTRCAAGASPGTETIRATPSR